MGFCSLEIFDISDKTNSRKSIQKHLESFERFYSELFDILADELCTLLKYEETVRMTSLDIINNVRNEFIPDKHIQLRCFLDFIATFTVNSATAEGGFKHLSRIKDHTRSMQLDERLDFLLRVYCRKELSEGMINNEKNTQFC